MKGGALTSGRRAQIMTHAREQGRVTIGGLAKIWSVSHETIRRDLKVLEETGDLMRVHGGAVLPNLVIERPFEERLTLNRFAKDKIAELAKALVSDEMSIFLDHSSTAVALSHRLEEFHKLTIVTNSLEVAKNAGNRTSNRVIVTGGEYRADEAGLLGFETVSQARQYHYDIVFNGIAGISAEHNLMDFEREEAELRQTLVQNTRRFVVLADSSKFSRKAFVESLKYNQISDFVSEIAPPNEVIKKYNLANITIHAPPTDKKVST